jgi:hypothetical protein
VYSSDRKQADSGSIWASLGSAVARMSSTPPVKVANKSVGVKLLNSVGVGSSVGRDWSDVDSSVGVADVDADEPEAGELEEDGSPEALCSSLVVSSGASDVVGSGSSDVVGSGPSDVVGSGSSEVVGSGSSEVVGSGSLDVVGSGSSDVVGSGSSDVVGSD